MEDFEVLINKAIEASKNSYSKFSKFKVGAALLTADNKIYLGCNIENSSYSLTNCAERTAFFNAVSNGCLEFKAIAIMGSNDEMFTDFCTPCGACRQVMSEFCNSDFKIVLGKFDNEKNLKIKIYDLVELLPECFKI